VPPALLEITSINRLVDVASRIVSKHGAALPQGKAAARWREWLARNIAAETQEAAQARWREWQQVLSTLGIREEHLAVALSSRSKAFMIFMHMAMGHGSGRVSFKVQTPHPLLRMRLPPPEHLPTVLKDQSKGLGPETKALPRCRGTWIAQQSSIRQDACLQ
jgi:hypothetical protein